MYFDQVHNYGTSYCMLVHYQWGLKPDSQLQTMLIQYEILLQLVHELVELRYNNLS